jgi:transcriptional regulator with XRE-family HTH domain
MKLGELISKLRDRRGWTQGQLAAYSTLNDAHISMIERGVRENPTIDTVAKIARALETSVDDMLIEIGLLPRHRLMHHHHQR